MAASTTRLSLMQAIARRLGGYTGSISSGDATSAVLAPLVGNVPDDELIDHLLVMPDAANTTDTERLLTDWTKSTGTATWAGSRSDTTYTSETFFTLPPASWTLDELRAAVNDVLDETRRTYRYIVPTLDDARVYQLQPITWLRDRDDVDGVYLRQSACMLHNEDFALWHNGTASAPDGWTLAGSGATAARATTFASHGPYTVQVTRVTNDATLVQDLPYQLAKQLIDDLADIAISVRCRVGVASRIRVGIDDGNDTTWSSYHSGDGEPEDLTATRTLTAAASRVRIVLSVDSGDTTGDFDSAIMVEGTTVENTLRDVGSDAMLTSRLPYNVLNAGSGIPLIDVGRAVGRGGQLIVLTRRPFATLSADSGTTEAPDQMVEHGTIYKLASRPKRYQDQTWMERLMAQHGQAYARLARGLIELPPQDPLRSVTVVGA